MKKVAIFSGTFDPVHEGHLDFGRLAIQEHNLDKVIFLVESEPRRKHTATAYQYRLHMVELAIANEPKMEVLVLDQPQFAVETTLPLVQARTKGAKLYLMLGDDTLRHVAQWPHVNKLIQSVTFMLAARLGSQSAIVDLISELEGVTGLSVDYVFIENQTKAISSQAIRKDLLLKRQPYGLPSSIQEYIKRNRLYSARDKFGIIG